MAGIASANPELPATVDSVLNDFIAAARRAFGPALRSAMLYGSAAEGRIRATSDVNLLLVLSAFEQSAADKLRDAMTVARAAIHLRVMFLLESEVTPALRAFAQKFDDILRRRRIIFGQDPFAGLNLSQQDEIIHLRQQLLNLVMRLRAFYVSQGMHEEQLALLVAEMAGPLRSCAATLRVLQGHTATSPKEALHKVAEELGQVGEQELLARLSEAREKRVLPPGVAAGIVFRLIGLAQAMHARAETLA